MTQYIVLFRGINVGGHNKLPMKPLVTLLQQNHFQDVASYIQSGNLVLKSDSNPSDKLKQLFDEHYDFTPDIFIMNITEFTQAMDNNPFKDKPGNTVHFYFAKQVINLNIEKLEQYILSTEAYYVKNNVFYLHAPDGIGRSKLVANIESCLGQTGTGRNLNTMNKLNTMC